jgi:hypothetical protein
LDFYALQTLDRPGYEGVQVHVSLQELVVLWTVYHNVVAVFEGEYNKLVLWARAGHGPASLGLLIPDLVQLGIAQFRSLISGFLVFNYTFLGLSCCRFALGLARASRGRQNSADRYFR